MMLQEFKEKYTDTKGMNGIISNITAVTYFDGGVNIHINYKSTLTSKPVPSIIHINYTSEKDCWRANVNDIQSRAWFFKYTKGIHNVIWLDEKFDEAVKDFNVKWFRSNNNTTLNWCNSSTAAETYVLCAEIWVLGTKGHQLKDDYTGYCADCKDCSGTVNGRAKYNKKFNIRPTNLQLVTKSHNSKLGNKIHDSALCV